MLSINKKKYLKSLDIKKYRQIEKKTFVEGFRIINEALKAGADKVGINTAAIKNPEFLENTIFTVDHIGRSGFSIPYIDGSLSISRASRTFPQYLVFKPSMILTAILLFYWLYKLLITYHPQGYSPQLYAHN